MTPSPTPSLDGEAGEPIDMLLYCPNCGMQHIDRPNRLEDVVHKSSGTVVDQLWTNPPHRSHLCRREDGGCGTVWRPADVPTNGVAELKTVGKADTWPAVHSEEVTAAAAIPALPPDTGKQAVRMLTPAEQFAIGLKGPVRIADIEAIQRKFCEVNGLPQPSFPPLAASQPAPDTGKQAIPAEVMEALDRMSTPLHASWGAVGEGGATAAADARCMKVIRDHIMQTANSQPAPTPDAAALAAPQVQGDGGKGTDHG